MMDRSQTELQERSKLTLQKLRFSAVAMTTSLIMALSACTKEVAGNLSPEDAAKIQAANKKSEEAAAKDKDVSARETQLKARQAELEKIQTELKTKGLQSTAAQKIAAAKLLEVQAEQARLTEERNTLAADKAKFAAEVQRLDTAIDELEQRVKALTDAGLAQFKTAAQAQIAELRSQRAQSLSTAGAPATAAASGAATTAAPADSSGGTQVVRLRSNEEALPTEQLPAVDEAARLQDQLNALTAASDRESQAAEALAARDGAQSTRDNTAEATANPTATVAAVAQTAAPVVADANSQVIEFLKTLKANEYYPVVVIVSTDGTNPNVNWTAIGEKVNGLDPNEAAKSRSVTEKGLITETYFVNISDAAALAAVIESIKGRGVVVRAFLVNDLAVNVTLNIKYTPPTTFGVAHQPIGGKPNGLRWSFDIGRSGLIEAGLKMVGLSSYDLTTQPGFGFLSDCNGVSPKCLSSLRNTGMLEERREMQPTKEIVTVREILIKEIEEALALYRTGRDGSGWHKSNRVVQNIELVVKPGILASATDGPSEKPQFFAIDFMKQTKMIKINPASRVAETVKALEAILAVLK